GLGPAIGGLCVRLWGDGRVAHSHASRQWRDGSFGRARRVFSAEAVHARGRVGLRHRTETRTSVRRSVGFGKVLGLPGLYRIATRAPAGNEPWPSRLAGGGLRTLSRPRRLGPASWQPPFRSAPWAGARP